MERFEILIFSITVQIPQLEQYPDTQYLNI